MNASSHFARTLRRLREKEHLSLRDLADRSGLSHGTIENIEQGRYTPKWTTVLALAAALQVSPEIFSEKFSRAP
jgi:transcriptional regulator with XRE-family HTH domain